MADVIAPLFLVVNLWIIAYPIQRIFARLRLPAVLGALAVGLLILLIVTGFVFAIGWSISQLVTELSRGVYQDRFGQIINDVVTWLNSIGIQEGQVFEQLQNISPQQIIGAASGALGSTMSVGTWSLAFLTILVGIVTDAPSMFARFLAASRTQPSVVASLVDFAQGVRRYWIVTAIFGAIVAVADVFLLQFLGIPLALVWGLLSFITNFIPTIGFILGVVPPTLMALFAKDAGTALLVLVLYFALNASIQSFIQPRFNGDAVGVTATVSILSLLVWAYALGPMGALLGLPATLLVKALVIDADPRLRWLNAYIASEPDTADIVDLPTESRTARLARMWAARKGKTVPPLVNALADGDVPAQDVAAASDQQKESTATDIPRVAAQAASAGFAAGVAAQNAESQSDGGEGTTSTGSQPTVAVPSVETPFPPIRVTPAPRAAAREDSTDDQRTVPIRREDIEDLEDE